MIEDECRMQIRTIETLPAITQILVDGRVVEERTDRELWGEDTTPNEMFTGHVEGLAWWLDDEVPA